MRHISSESQCTEEGGKGDGGGADVDVSTKGMGWHVGPTTWL